MQKKSKNFYDSFLKIAGNRRTFEGIELSITLWGAHTCQCGKQSDDKRQTSSATVTSWSAQLSENLIASSKPRELDGGDGQTD